MVGNCWIVANFLAVVFSKSAEVGAMSSSPSAGLRGVVGGQAPSQSIPAYAANILQSQGRGRSRERSESPSSQERYPSPHGKGSSWRFDLFHTIKGDESPLDRVEESPLSRRFDSARRRSGPTLADLEERDALNIGSAKMRRASLMRPSPLP